MSDDYSDKIVDRIMNVDPMTSYLASVFADLLQKVDSTCNAYGVDLTFEMKDEISKEAAKIACREGARYMKRTAPRAVITDVHIVPVREGDDIWKIIDNITKKGHP